MISSVPVSARFASPVKPRFTGETSQKLVESPVNHEISQGGTRFWPLLSTIALAGVGGAVAYRQTGTMALMSKQIAKLGQELPNIPLPKPMGWGQWLWEKIAVPGTAILGLAGAVFNRGSLDQLVENTRNTFLNVDDFNANGLVGLLRQPIQQDFIIRN